MAAAFDITPPRIVSHPIRGDDDFWRVHRLLVETAPITPPDFNWDIRRWEGSRFYNASPSWDPAWETQVNLWETDTRRVVGAVNADGAGLAYLQVHPDYRAFVEDDMLDWAEAHLAAPTGGGNQRRLHLFVYDYDEPRLQRLAQRGYEKTLGWGVVRRLRFGSQPLRLPALAQGYTLRATHPGDLADCQRIADLLNAAFNRDFHTAQECQTFTRMAPCFRSDLDLVAVAPDGSFATYVGVPYDEVNRSGIFEPVCTHPDHRRKALAQTLMLEGLQRLRALGACNVTVATGSAEPANRLYASLGFTEVYRGYFWRKVF